MATEINLQRKMIQIFTDLFLGYALTFIFIIGYALILTYTNINDTYIMFVTLLGTIVSVVYVGYRFAVNAESKGMLWGILGGILYCVVFVSIGVLLSDNYSFDKKIVFIFVFSLLSGAIGGIIGINNKK